MPPVTSANSPVFVFTVDTAGPSAPVVTSVIDDVGPVTGTLTSGSTNDTKPTFNGTGEVGSTVHIIVDGSEIGTAVVNAQGNWTFTRVPRSRKGHMPSPSTPPILQAIPARRHRLNENDGGYLRTDSAVHFDRER
jgi:hypothetical protein